MESAAQEMTCDNPLRRRLAPVLALALLSLAATVCRPGTESHPPRRAIPRRPPPRVAARPAPRTKPRLRPRRAAPRLAPRLKGVTRRIGVLARKFTSAVTVPLSDGRILIAGSLWATTDHLFDPRAGTAAALPSMPARRPKAAAVRLADGRVLVAGGRPKSYSDTSSQTDAALFDPKTLTWRKVAPLATARQQASAVLLADGRALVFGGMGDTDESLASSEIFDPKRGTFSAGPKLHEARWQHQTVHFPDGTIWVVGGYVHGVGYHRSIEALDRKTGRWRQVATKLPQGFRSDQVVALAGGGLLALGGQGLGMGSAAFGVAAYRLDASVKQWRRLPNPRPRDPLTRGVLTALPDGSAALCGGRSPSRTYYPDCDVFDPRTNAWSVGFRFPAPRAGDDVAVTLPGGRVVLLGATSTVLALE